MSMERLFGFGQEAAVEGDLKAGSLAGILGETVLSGLFIGEIADLAFLKEMENKRARNNLKMIAFGLGSLGTMAISLKCGAEAGGAVTLISGLSLLYLSEKYLILKVLERFKKDSSLAPTASQADARYRTPQGH